MPTLEKIIIVFLLIFFGLSLFQVVSTLKSTTTYKLNGKSYRLLIADTAEKQKKGLMFVKNLRGIDGMVFIFKDKSMRAFWNKNTYIDLKVVWMSDDKVISQTDLPSIEKSKQIIMIYSPVPVNKVIELKK